MNGSQDRYELDLIEEELKELKSVFDTINKQTVAIEKLVVEMKFMREDHIKLDRRIKELENKPVEVKELGNRKRSLEIIEESLQLYKTEILKK